MLENSASILITTADIPGALRILESMQILLRDVKMVGDISITCVVDKRHSRLVQQRLESRGDRVEILRKFGIVNQIHNAIRRPILAIITLWIVMFSFWIPTRILFVEVEGNTTVATNHILEQAARTGVCFGASRRFVKSEQVKNSILAAMPDLQWVGVTTSGCVAKISVKERDVSEQVRTEDGLVSNMVATQDGIITECTVRRGNGLCKIGQAVTAGELLVSGYTDCGLIVRATNVDAEISADTLRDLKAITPAIYMRRTIEKDSERRYSLLIGKKLINFFKDSGISDTTCVKMYEKKYLMLPGGVSLPIAVIIENRAYFEMESALLSEKSSSVLLEEAVRDYLFSQMVSGRIKHADVHVRIDGDRYCLAGRYACNEMIGQVVYEENAYNYGENN